MTVDSEEKAAFGRLISGMGGGLDRGSLFPRTDAEDLGKGARFIPGEVTLARRAGQQVLFVMNCGPNCWYWEMPDGSRIYHYDPEIYEVIGRRNHGEDWTREDGPAGACTNCGNPHTAGGTVPAEEITEKPVANPDLMTAAVSTLDDALARGTAAGVIEAQEAAGQRSFVNSTTLPSDMGDGGREGLETAGVVFGEPVEGDPMFTYVTLPDGWKKVATGHSMWSDLVDDKGRKRASIFYKAAFYDRSAFLRIERRFTMREDYEREDAIVVRAFDGSEIVFTSQEYPYAERYSEEYSSQRQKALDEVSAWFAEHWPDWENAGAYWD